MLVVLEQVDNHRQSHRLALVTNLIEFAWVETEEQFDQAIEGVSDEMANSKG